ncbi:MAG: hypothetical protein M5R42_03740 [Rhodocyclaceae bacterium]|nr:hypothetical protein [Rhodocyclaceae bacterium]
MVWAEPDGGRLLEFSGQPSGTFCYMIAVGPDGRVREIRQAFSEENLRRVVPGLTQDETRRLLGGPEGKTALRAQAGRGGLVLAHRGHHGKNRALQRLLRR